MLGLIVLINNCIKISRLHTVSLSISQLSAGKSDFEKSLQFSGPELPALSHVYGVVYHIYEDSYRSVT